MLAVFAVAVAAVASAIHLCGQFPAPTVRNAIWSVMPLLALGWLGISPSHGLRLHTPFGPRFGPFLVPGPGVRLTLRRVCGTLLAGALACNLLSSTIDSALAGRLDPALDGRSLEALIVVDEMPDRRTFGDRVAGTVLACTVLDASTDDAGCANLERVQLEWAPARQRDRDEPARRGTWPEPGEHWRVQFRARQPSASVNPGGFDVELRLLQNGIGATGRVTTRHRVSSDEAPAPGLAARIGVRFESLRASLRTALERQVSTRVSVGEQRWSEVAVLTALALGDQKAIDPTLWSLFARTGVSHLMAISGMHVTMLALAISSVVGWAMRRSVRNGARALGVLTRGVPRQRITLLLAVALAFFYARLSGWGIPSQRTCWMLACAALLTLSPRRGGPLSITAVASLPVLLSSPWAIGAAGFWLSFVAVAALVWQAQGVGGGAARQRWREPFLAQWASSIALLPLTAALFSMASLIGPPVNLVAIPWVSLLVTPLALLLTASAPLAAELPLLDGPWQVLLDCSGGAVRVMLHALHWVDRVPGANVALPEPGWAVMLLAVAAVMLLLAPTGPGLRALAALALLPLAIGARDAPAPGELRITALDIGQGSAILVETDDAAVLYDTGAGQGRDRTSARSQLLPWFARRGLARLDLLVVSHLDAEHAGGAATVIDAMAPRRLLTPFDPRMLLAHDLPQGIEALRCVQGEGFSIGRTSVFVLGPTQPPQGRKAAADNAASCVLRIAAPGGSVLLAGDLPSRAERALIDANDAGSLASTVLLVPAQGSRMAAGAALIGAVRPDIAIVQLPRRNRHGHPHPSVLARLGEAGARVLRTDLDGALRITLRAHAEPAVTRARRDAPPYWRIVDRDG